MSELELTKLKTRLEGFEKIISKFIDIAEELKFEIAEGIQQLEEEEYVREEQEARKR